MIHSSALARGLLSQSNTSTRKFLLDQDITEKPPDQVAFALWSNAKFLADKFVKKARALRVAAPAIHRQQISFDVFKRSLDSRCGVDAVYGLRESSTVTFKTVHWSAQISYSGLSCFSDLCGWHGHSARDAGCCSGAY